MERNDNYNIIMGTFKNARSSFTGKTIQFLHPASMNDSRSFAMSMRVWGLTLFFWETSSVSRNSEVQHSTVRVANHV